MDGSSRAVPNNAANMAHRDAGGGAVHSINSGLQLTRSDQPTWADYGKFRSAMMVAISGPSTCGPACCTTTATRSCGKAARQDTMRGSLDNAQSGESAGVLAILFKDVDLPMLPPAHPHRSPPSPNLLNSRYSAQ